MALTLFLILQAWRQSLVHQLTRGSVVSHTPVHRISCPRRYVHGGGRFGIWQWDNTDRERSNGRFRELGKPRLLPLDVLRGPRKPFGSAGPEDKPNDHFFWGTLEFCLAEAASLPPTSWSRAALLVAPARTFLLEEELRAHCIQEELRMRSSYQPPICTYLKHPLKCD